MSAIPPTEEGKDLRKAPTITSKGHTFILPINQKMADSGLGIYLMLTNITRTGELVFIRAKRNKFYNFPAELEIHREQMVKDLYTSLDFCRVDC